MKIVKGLEAFLWNNPAENNCNTFLVEGVQPILIDPGHRHLFGYLEGHLARSGVTPEQIAVVIVTHGHPDHVEGAASLPSTTRFAINEEEYRFIGEHAGNRLDLPVPDFFLREGDLRIGEEVFQVLHTPGHSPGSVSLYWPERKALFSGDVIFSQGIGRTDLPGGDGNLLKRSITRLAGLDVEYLLPGHGEILSGREQVRENFETIARYWFDML